MWGFNGSLPPWMGGLAWLFLLIGRVKDLIDVAVLRTEERQIEQLAKKLDTAINDLRTKQCEKD
jgi:hypothetical protein